MRSARPPSRISPWGPAGGGDRRALAFDAARRARTLRRVGLAGLIVAGAAGGFWAAGTETGERITAGAAALMDDVVAGPTAQPLTTRVLSRMASDRPGAPLTVKAHPELSHVVKLVDLRTGRTALTLSLAAGETIRTTVPPGRYEFRTASGETWYGEEHLFGWLGQVERARSPLTVRPGRGHEIDLNRRPDGNMAVDWMSQSRF